MRRQNYCYLLKYHLSKLLVFATKPNEIPKADELRARYIGLLAIKQTLRG